jgi:hypothetical protein
MEKDEEGTLRELERDDPAFGKGSAERGAWP